MNRRVGAFLERGPDKLVACLLLGPANVEDLPDYPAHDGDLNAAFA
jgi:hypothetical protein